MSESIQISPSASATAQQSKLSSQETANNLESTDDSSGFTAVFASYSESDNDSIEQKTDENVTELINELLPLDMAEDGNALPQQEQTALWQALFMLTPNENLPQNLVPTQTEGISLIESQRKPALPPSLVSQDYFNLLAMQNKGSGDSPSGLQLNSINMQLAAAQFNPETKDALLLNVNDSLVPTQAVSSTLSHGLAAVGLGTATQAATTQTQLAPINLSQNAWESNLGSRLQMLIGQNVQTAEVRLDPPELGTLDIKIKVINDVANVHITSQHAHVRDAIETTVPRLREMFEQSGLSLGDVNVSQESFTQQQNSPEQEVVNASVDNHSDFDDEPVLVTRKIVSDSLLDTYA